MGGRGSGRSGSFGLLITKTDDYLSIDLAWMQRHGCLKPGGAGSLSWSRGGSTTNSIRYRTEADGLRLIYKTKDGENSWRDVNELVPLARSLTKFGGSRQWFLCPSCSKRCRILYGGTLFRCRRCHGLRYESQYEPDFACAASRSHKLRAKLGHIGSLDEPFPPKPRGMRWRTYDRLRAEDERLQSLWGAGIMHRFGLIDEDA